MELESQFNQRYTLHFFTVPNNVNPLENTQPTPKTLVFTLAMRRENVYTKIVKKTGKKSITMFP